MKSAKQWVAENSQSGAFDCVFDTEQAEALVKAIQDDALANVPPAPTGKEPRNSWDGADDAVLRKAYTSREIHAELNAWMVAQFDHPRDGISDPDQQNQWYRDYGLISHFLRDHFPG